MGVLRAACEVSVNGENCCCKDREGNKTGTGRGGGVSLAVWLCATPFWDRTPPQEPLLSCVLAQHSTQSKRCTKPRIFLNSLRCQHRRSLPLGFKSLEGGVRPHPQYEKHEFANDKALSFSPMFGITWAKRSYPALRKDTILPSKKYGSTSTHWVSNSFVQHPDSRTKNIIQSESDGSNLNKMSKLLHFQAEAAHRHYASQVTLAQPAP